MCIPVEQQQVAPVSSYADIEGKIAEGTRNRTVAATNMNATSSRAHTIVAINFTQKAKNDAGKSMTKTSIINLVDLAGRCVLFVKKKYANILFPVISQTLGLENSRASTEKGRLRS